MIRLKLISASNLGLREEHRMHRPYFSHINALREYVVAQGLVQANELGDSRCFGLAISESEYRLARLRNMPPRAPDRVFATTQDEKIARVETRIKQLTQLKVFFEGNPQVEFLGMYGWGQHCRFLAPRDRGMAQYDAVVYRKGKTIFVEQLGSSWQLFSPETPQIDGPLTPQMKVYSNGGRRFKVEGSDSSFRFSKRSFWEHRDGQSVRIRFQAYRRSELRAKIALEFPTLSQYKKIDQKKRLGHLYWTIKDPSLGQTYWFDSLSDMNRAMTENAVLKSSYSRTNIFKWGRVHWWRPFSPHSTLKYLGQSASTGVVLNQVPDGPDDLAIAIKNSGVSSHLGNLIQLGLFFAFLKVISFGYKGVSEEAKEILEKGDVLEILQSQLTQSGLGAMWWSIAVSFAQAATAEGALIAGAHLDHVIKQLDKSAGYLAVAGQIQMAIAAILKFVLGIQSERELKKWRQLILDSPLLTDKPDVRAGLVSYINYLRAYNVLDDIVGGMGLALGQVAMILGGPVGPWGLPVLAGGAGLTIGAVALSAVTDGSRSRRFTINQEFSDDEQAVLNDPYTDDSEKMNALLELGRQFHGNLIWLKIIKQLIKLSKNTRLKSSDEVVQWIKRRVCSHYKRSGYLADILKSTQQLFDHPDTAETIKTLWAMRDHPLELMMTAIRLIDPDASRISLPLDMPIQAQLLRWIVQRDLWPNTRRKLMKKLIIQYRSANNRKGERFDRYISSRPMYKFRKFSLPNLIPFGSLLGLKFPKIRPLVDWQWTLTWLPMKRRTVYFFNDELFMSDMKSGYLDHNPIINQMTTALVSGHNSAVFHSVRSQWKNRIKSNAYRPVWQGVMGIVQRAANEDVELTDTPLIR